MRPSVFHRWWVTSLLVCACAGSDEPADSATECNASPATTSAADAATPPSVFLAFAKDFQGYHSWPSFDTSEDADLVGIHDGSVVTEYIRRTPPSGSTEFPVATLIVK